MAYHACVGADMAKHAGILLAFTYSFPVYSLGLYVCKGGLLGRDNMPVFIARL